MEALGEELESKASSKNDLILNQNGSKGKFSVYTRPISTFEPQKVKTILYLLSWMIKMGGKIAMAIFRRKKMINKVAFFVIYFHNKIHFAIFNVYISSGAFLVARTMIHMKLVP